jgi:hypothetical protein
VAGDLLLMELAKYVLKEESACPKKHDFNATNSSLEVTGKSADTTAKLAFHIIEMILQITSTTILVFFNIELLVKLMIVPKIFIESKLEILDAFVVVVSLALNIVLMAIRDKEQIISTLLVLVR